jgi:hypothetical protein
LVLAFFTVFFFRVVFFRDGDAVRTTAKVLSGFLFAYS